MGAVFTTPKRLGMDDFPLVFPVTYARFQTAKKWLEPRGIPCFQFMEEPFEMLALLWRYRRVSERNSPYCVFCDCELGRPAEVRTQKRELEYA